MSYLNDAVFKCPFNMSENVMSRNVKFSASFSSDFDIC